MLSTTYSHFSSSVFQLTFFDILPTDQDFFYFLLSNKEIIELNNDELYVIEKKHLLLTAAAVPIQK